MESPIGQPLHRKEDRRLLTGQGRFVDDFARPGQVYASFLRSPHAHARIVAIDTALAAAAPGVIGILTARDYVADGLGPLQHNVSGLDHLDVTKPGFGPETIAHGPLPHQMPIAGERVRYVGEAVAVVVARSPAEALDAAETIEVEYESLPAVTDVRAAAAPGAPLLWDDRPGNLCVDADKGDRAGTAAALARAPCVLRLESLNHRVSAAPMEPRGALAEFDAATGLFTLHTASQGVHRHKAPLVAIFGGAPDLVRVVTGDVGGGFGARSPCYPEYPLLLWAARRFGAPVKWTSTRQEAFVTDAQSRDVFVKGALGLDRDGRFLALQLDYLGNLGAFPTSLAVLLNVQRMAAAVYDIPALYVRTRGIVTNTVPVGVYRGAGRPESNFILERLIDMAASELGLDRVAIRRRNLIPASALPYQSPLGHRYDTGEFAENMEKVLRLADWEGFPARRAAARARGLLAGNAIVNYLESPTGQPTERTDVTVRPEGRVTAVIGTQASGQGHETSFAQVVAAQLQIPVEQVEIDFGDSAVAVSGGGSHSDRSMRLGGTILVRASEAILARGRELAAHRLEASEADIVFAEGRFTVAGTDRSLGLFEVAAVGLDPAAPEALRGPLAATSEIGQRLPAHPNGAAACEVEIDPDSGTVRVMRYVTVDDVGMIINPMIVEGQVHGGIAQGIGQALMEQCVYSPDSGQPVTGSFLDYCMPRAAELPFYVTASNEIGAASNPLGVKGAGECGITPATAVVVNAIVDALRDFDVRHLEMPATSERVWRVIHEASGAPQGGIPER